MAKHSKISAQLDETNIQHSNIWKYGFFKWNRTASQEFGLHYCWSQHSGISKRRLWEKSDVETNLLSIWHQVIYRMR